MASSVSIEYYDVETDGTGLSDRLETLAPSIVPTDWIIPRVRIVGGFIKIQSPHLSQDSHQGFLCFIKRQCTGIKGSGYSISVIVFYHCKNNGLACYGRKCISHMIVEYFSTPFIFSE